MHILIAPNALKGSLTASQAGAAIAKGITAADPAISTKIVPIADGGDGLVEIALSELGGRAQSTPVTGPRGEAHEAAWVLLASEAPEGRPRAVIETALASGLALTPDDARNPEARSAIGAGQLMKAALDAGARHLIIGIGGSVTNDGGLGIAAALGARFLDANGATLPPIGASLHAVDRIDLAALDPRLRETRIEVMCDVDNPLTGPKGAAAIYGPQKGADADMVSRLDAGLAHLVEALSRPLGSERARAMAVTPGAGAAGGMGFGLMAFCGATLRPGAETILDLVGFDPALAHADLLMTAEGALDASTAHGKAPAAAARRAKANGVPVIAFGGGLARDRQPLRQAGFDAVFSLVPGPMSLEKAMAEAADYLSAASEEVVRLLKVGSRVG